MRLEDYTDLTICNAMGLSQFDPIGIPDIIRVLLKPSFHPEACITLEPTRLYVVALRSQLWSEPVPRLLPQLSEEVVVSAEEFNITVEAFKGAVAENAGGSSLCVDGMPYSAVYKKQQQMVRTRGNSFGPGEVAFLGGFLRLAHARVSSIHLRNRIAECGRYVDRTFVMESEPELRNTTRILVLGAPEDRADYLDMLRQGTKPKPAPS
ncbi:MAG TPA: hypothetical protein VGN88_08925 [Phycisphaerae bacterium]|jgi:hypothetical protein